MNQQNTTPEKPVSDEGWYGMFYYNANDRRVMVPKRYGWGATLNFAQPEAYLVLSIPLICATAIVLCAWFARG